MEEFSGTIFLKRLVYSFNKVVDGWWCYGHNLRDKFESYFKLFKVGYVTSGKPIILGLRQTPQGPIVCDT